MNRMIGVIAFLVFSTLGGVMSTLWGAETTGGSPLSPPAVPDSEQRTALVIGNGSYEIPLFVIPSAMPEPSPRH